MRRAVAMHIGRLSLASTQQRFCSPLTRKIFVSPSVRISRPSCPVHSRPTSSLTSFSAILRETGGFTERGFRRTGSPGAYAEAQDIRQAPTIGDVTWSPDLVNSVSLIGRTGRPFDLIETSKSPVAKSTLAVSVGKDKTEWFDLEIWGPLGVLAMQQVGQGSQIRVEGRVRANEWTDRQGNMRKGFKISVDRLQRVLSPGGYDRQGSNGTFNAVPQQSSTFDAVPQQDVEFNVTPARAPWDDDRTMHEPVNTWAASPVAAWDQPQAQADLHQAQVFRESGEPPAAQQPENKWDKFSGNPSQYWDNRFNKRSPRAPDFKHKETGEALWISGRDTPDWVPAWVEQHMPPE